VGAGIGLAAPPVVGGAIRALSATGRAIGATGRALRSGGARPSADYEAPVLPVGRPVEGASFLSASGPPAPEAFGAQEGALRMIADWIMSAGGTIDDVERAWAAVQQSRVFHGSGEALNAQTLAEIYPPLQRLLRAGASSYREVGEDVTRFLQARHTGILPRGASEGDLAQRGLPTRERFLAGRTVGENREQFGVQLGTGENNVSPTGALGRIVDATKRLFRIKDAEFHGHASTGGKTSEEILAAMQEASAPAYRKAYAVGDVVSVRPALSPIIQRWQNEAAQYGSGYRSMIGKAANRFVDDSGKPVRSLRAFDKAKQEMDDEIGVFLAKGRNFEAGELTRLKNEMIDAVDKIQPGKLGDLYSEARGIYARGARDRDILEDFKRAWKDDPDEVLKRYDGLASDGEKKLARLGIVWGMEAENASKRATQDVTLGFDVNRAERMLTLIGQRMRAGEADAADVMRRFGTYIAGEQEMVRGTARTAIGGSMTDRNLQDALSLGGMEIVQNVQSFANIWRGSTSLFELGRAVLEKIVDRAFGLSADRAREMSRLLLTANPDEITAIIARLRLTMSTSRMARFNELMQQAQLAIGAPSIGAGGNLGGAIAGAPSATLSGGPVSL
jgi:hypothetical protein